MKKIYVGAAYYPEMWEESEVDRDIVRMKEAGVNVVRVAEFAWGKMEPEEGKFDLGWLERAVDKLYQAGIDVIMCTPTCTPPRWLLNKYPETRTVYADGTRTEVFAASYHSSVGVRPIRLRYSVGAPCLKSLTIWPTWSKSISFSVPRYPRRAFLPACW